MDMAIEINVFVYVSNHVATRFFNSPLKHVFCDVKRSIFDIKTIKNYLK